MSQRHILPALAAASALVFLPSCASEPDSAWGSFAGAWEDGYRDSKDLFGEQFFNLDADDPYARPNGWAAQGDDRGRSAKRLLLDAGDDAGARVPRYGEGRNESATRDLWNWILDID